MKENKAVKNQVIPASVYFIHLLFAVYFIVLTAERIQSIVRSVRDPDVLLLGDGFNCYTYLIAFVSLAVSLIYLIVSNGNVFVGIFTRGAGGHESVRMERLCIAAGLILSLLFFVVRMHGTASVVELDESSDETAVYLLSGPLFFGRRFLSILCLSCRVR